jgi:hypothetical protein
VRAFFRLQGPKSGGNKLLALFLTASSLLRHRRHKQKKLAEARFFVRENFVIQAESD